MTHLNFSVIVQGLDQFARELAVEKDMPGLDVRHLLLPLEDKFKRLDQIEGGFDEVTGPQEDLAIDH